MKRTIDLPLNENGTFKREFIANGKEYIICDPAELGLKRFVECQKQGRVVGQGGISLPEAIADNEKTVQIVNGMFLGQNTGTELVAHAAALQEKIKWSGQRWYDAILQYCTTFILAKDEDHRQYIISEQETKIDDWNEEGYRYLSFFALCMSTIPGLKDTLEKAGKMERVVRELSLVDGVSTTGTST